MMDEIEELWSLADECREWQARMFKLEQAQGVESEFRRLAMKLDEIAKRLAARMPT